MADIFARIILCSGAFPEYSEACVSAAQSPPLSAGTNVPPSVATIKGVFNSCQPPPSVAGCSPKLNSFMFQTL